MNINGASVKWVKPTSVKKEKGLEQAKWLFKRRTRRQDEGPRAKEERRFASKQNDKFRTKQCLLLWSLNRC
jgi:hypothetical protein